MKTQIQLIFRKLGLATLIFSAASAVTPAARAVSFNFTKIPSMNVAFRTSANALAKPHHVVKQQQHVGEID
jgi:hypothetical protein